MRTEFLSGFIRNLPVGYLLRTMLRGDYLAHTIKAWISTERASALVMRGSDVLAWNDELLALADPPLSIKGIVGKTSETYQRAIVGPLGISQPMRGVFVLDHPSTVMRLLRLDRNQEAGAFETALGNNPGKYLGDGGKGARSRYIALNKDLRPASGSSIEYVAVGVPEEQARAIETWAEQHQIEIDRLVPAQLAVIEVMRAFAKAANLGPVFLIISSGHSHPSVVCLDPDKGVVFMGEPPEASDHSIFAIISEIASERQLPETTPVFQFDRMGGSVAEGAHALDVEQLARVFGPVVPKDKESSFPVLPGADGAVLRNL